MRTPPLRDPWAVLQIGTLASGPTLRIWQKSWIHIWCANPQNQTKRKLPCTFCILPFCLTFLLKDKILKQHVPYLHASPKTPSYKFGRKNFWRSVGGQGFSIFTKGFSMKASLGSWKLFPLKLFVLSFSSWPLRWMLLAKWEMVLKPWPASREKTNRTLWVVTYVIAMKRMNEPLCTTEIQEKLQAKERVLNYIYVFCRRRRRGPPIPPSVAARTCWFLSCACETVSVRLLDLTKFYEATRIRWRLQTRKCYSVQWGGPQTTWLKTVYRQNSPQQSMNYKLQPALKMGLSSTREVLLKIYAEGHIHVVSAK